MKHRLLTTIVLVALLATTSAFAQDPGDAGVFFDPAGTVSRGILPAFVPTNVYVIGFDLAGDVAGYEGSLAISDPSILILATILSGPGPLNVGTPTNFIVGAGGCFSGAGATILITYQVGNFTGAPLNDLLFCLGSATPSSFAPATPGYLDCSSNLLPFGVAQNGGGVYPNGCGVADATAPDFPVGAVQTSWGAVKSQF